MFPAIARIAVGLFLVAVLGFTASLAAQERIRIGWAGASPANSPIWVAQENHYLGNKALTSRSSVSPRVRSPFRPCWQESWM